MANETTNSIPEVSNNSVENTAVKLFDCRIAMRGKGAKGFKWVKTLGKPKKVKGDKGITKKWDHSHLLTVPFETLVEKVKHLGDVNLALVLGMDRMQMSGNVKSISEIYLIIADLNKLGLAMGPIDARMTAKSFVDSRLSMQKAGMEAPTIQSYIERRKVTVAKMKAEGKWVLESSNSENPIEDAEEDDDVEEVDELEDLSDSSEAEV